MDTPLVSVILATFNGASYIKQAIDSVLAQDYIHLELIIIDDASSDDTSTILAQYAKNNVRIRVVRNDHNMKLVASLNL
jgi:glycosyltransferase involved in cell wall biosynthesis